jgi:hypothetical protein
VALGRGGLLPIQRSVGNQAIGRLMEGLSSHQDLPAMGEARSDPGGAPLDPATRRLMEEYLGADLGSVRVQVEQGAPATASERESSAQTVGTKLVFSAGRYQPGSPGGRALLVHELTHAIQAMAGTSRLGQPASSVDTLEREAREVARAFRSGRVSPPVQGVARGLAVALRGGPDDPTGDATFGDIVSPLEVDPETGRTTLPQPDPKQVAERVELRIEQGAWVEAGRDGVRRASGMYSYVVQNGRVYGSRYGHLAAAAGGRVSYAGEVMFTDGTVEFWNAGSGTYRPAQFVRDRAPFDPGKYRPMASDPGEKRLYPQLPVFQEGSSAGLKARRPRPAQVPPGSAPAPPAPASTRGQPPPGVPARSEPQAPASRPAPPVGSGVAGPSTARRTEPAKPSEPTATAGRPLRTEAVNAGIMLAHSIIRDGLTQISSDKAQAEAWTEYYAESHQIVDELWDRPGEGAVLRFGFAHVRHPSADMPDRTRYLGMQRAISRSPQVRVPLPQSWGERELRDISPENVTYETIARWIPPVRLAEAGGALRAAAETAPEKAPVFVGTVADLALVLQPLLQREGFVGTTLSEYELLTRGQPGFAGYEVAVPNGRMLIVHGVRDQRLEEVTSRLRERLTGRADALQADIEREESRLREYLQERWPFTIRRGDIKLDPHMFDRPKAHLSSARGTMSLGAFRHAWESIQQGERHVYQNWKVLYHYSRGHPYEGAD